VQEVNNYKTSKVSLEASSTAGVRGNFRMSERRYRNHESLPSSCMINERKSYRGKDLADGRFDLEFLRSTVHVAADHVGHRLQPDTEVVGQHGFMTRVQVEVYSTNTS